MCYLGIPLGDLWGSLWWILVGSPGIFSTWDPQRVSRNLQISAIARDLWESMDILGMTLRKTLRKRRRIKETNDILNHIVMTNWFVVHVYIYIYVYVRMYVSVVCIHMIQRNVFKVYKIDDRIWYTRNTAFSETWQNGAYISSFSVNPSYRIPSGWGFDS